MRGRPTGGRPCVCVREKERSFIAVAMPEYKVVGIKKLTAYWEDREKDCGGCIVHRYKYDGQDFQKGKKRKDEPQGGISWPNSIPATEDVVDMNRYTLENNEMWYLLEKVHG